MDAEPPDPTGPADPAGTGPSGSDAARETCPQCGESVPSFDFCCSCGFPLGRARSQPGDGRPHSYAAHPSESRWTPALVSTVFPRLPTRDLAAVRVALASGLVLLVVLGAAGLFPVGLAACAVLLPLLLLLYLYDVDVYEDEPLRIVALTMLWGLAAGVAIGLVLLHQHPPVAADGLGALGTGPVLTRVVILPLIDLALALVGPVVLLRRPRFNDVLDGVFFGAASAVTLVGAQMLVQAWPLVRTGLRPLQATSASTLRLLELGVLVPVIAACSVAWVCAALWLRFRVPTRGPRPLGPFGAPLVAVIVAIGFLVVTAGVQQFLDEPVRALVLVGVAAAALVLLRNAVHVGLLEEAHEHGLQPDAGCANCGRNTPVWAFCARCGVALRALPQPPDASRPDPDGTEPTTPPTADRESRWDRRILLTLYWAGLGLTCILAVVVTLVATPGAPKSTCPKGQLCPGPPGRPVSSFATWSDPALGVRFQYPTALFTVSSRSDGSIRLRLRGGNGVPGGVEATGWVTAVSARDASASELMRRRQSELAPSILGLTPDDSSATVLPALQIGGVPATGGAYRGSIDTPQGPTVPAEVTLAAAGNGRASVVVSYVISGTVDPVQVRLVRSYFSPVFSTFSWHD